MLPSLFTKKNLEILDLLVNEEMHIRDIADKLKISPGKVHQTIQLLKKNNLIKEKKIKNRIIILLNQENILLQKIKSLINLFKLTNSKEYKKLEKFGDIGIYGSYANGTDDKDSDIDLWIYTKEKQSNIMEIIRNLEKVLKKKINLLILNKDKIKNLKKNDPEFYIRLKLTSITKRGEIFV